MGYFKYVIVLDPTHRSRDTAHDSTNFTIKMVDAFVIYSSYDWARHKKFDGHDVLSVGVWLWSRDRLYTDINGGVQ